MRFDSASIYTLRNPFGDESIVNIVRIAAVSDSSLMVNTLIQCIDSPMTVIDLLPADSDIPRHFRLYRPDILMINTDMLGGGFLAGLTASLESEGRRMPCLISVGRREDSELAELAERYSSRYHARTPFDPLAEGESVRRFIVTELIGGEYFSRKLRMSAELTLRAMHTDDTAAGFDYLADEVTIVLENAFTYMAGAAALHKAVGTLRGITPAAVDHAVRPLVGEAISRMTETEFAICFSAYTCRGISPAEPEFVYAAASLTSISCGELLRCIYTRPHSHSPSPPGRARRKIKKY